MRTAWKLLVRAYPFSRGRARLITLARRHITGVVLEEDSLGNRLLLDLDNYIDSMIYLEGSYERGEVRDLGERAKRRGCTHFIDVGANLGAYSLYFARQAMIREIWAFEPDPRNFAQLSANLWLNQLSHRVKSSSCAMSSEAGETTFYINDPEQRRGGLHLNTATSSLMKAGAANHTPIDVLTQRLDDAAPLADKDIVIKIDVEGAELLVLEGAEQLLRRNRCLVMVEVFSQPPERLERVVQFMASLGYTRQETESGSENRLFANDSAM